MKICIWLARVIALSKLAALVGVACVVVSPRASEAADRVILHLRFDHQFQFAGYYAALWQGYYADRGLEVEIRGAFGPDGRYRASTREVAERRADFGIGAADILLARDAGAPLVVVASVVPQSASAFFVRADSAIEEIHDLAGRRVARLEGDLIDVEFQAVLREAGVSTDAFVSVPHRPGEGVAPLRDGLVDVMPGYRISVPPMADTDGFAVRQIRPEDYGVDFYGDSLFTREDLLAARPDLVERFVAASIEGWRYALEHPGDIALRITNGLPSVVQRPDRLEFNVDQALLLKEMLQSDTVPLGEIVPERWQRMQRELAWAGVVSTPHLPAAALHDDGARLARLRGRQRDRLVAVLVAAGALLAVGGIVSWSLSLRAQAAAGKISHAVTATGGAVLAWHPAERRVEFNAGAPEALGLREAAAPTSVTGFLELVDHRDRDEVEAAFAADPATYDARPDVEWRLADEASPSWYLLRLRRAATHVVGVITDITARKTAEAALMEQAYRDPLTGIANRRGLADWVETHLADPAGAPLPATVCLIDLDGFKGINDTLGHAAGDVVLCRVAAMLAGAVPDGALSARLGGDEFAVVMPDVAKGHARRWAARIVAALALPQPVAGHRLGVGVSVGLVTGDLRRDGLVTLLASADSALYDVKRNRNRCRVGERRTVVSIGE